MDPDPERPEERVTAPAVRLQCEHCGRATRLRIPKPPVPVRTPCEHCGAAIRLERVHVLGPDEFAATLHASPIPVLVDFHADWCGPCRWLEPVLDQLASSSAGRYLVAKVDTERAPEAAREHRIGSVPTVILFEGGREIRRSLGVEPERLRAWLSLPAAGVRAGS